MLKAILSNSFSTLILRGATFGIRVICILAAAKYVSPQTFGTISIYLAIAEISRVAADCGIDTYLIRTMASISYGEKQASEINGGITAKLILGSIFGLISSYVMFLRNHDLPLLIIVFSLLCVTPLFVNFSTNFFISRLEGHKIVPLVVSASLVTLVIYFTLVGSTGDVVKALFIVPFYEIVISLLLFMRLRKYFLPIRISPGAAVNLLKKSAPLGIAIIVGFSYGKIDIFFLDSFCGKQAVGIYGFWLRVIEPFLFVSGAMAINAYGHLSNNYQNEIKEFLNTQKYYGLVFIGYVICVVILLNVFGIIAIKHLYRSYIDSIAIGRLMSILFIVRTLNLMLTANLQAMGKNMLVMYLSFWNFVFLCVLIFPLGHLFGFTGVISSVLTMESVNSIIQIVLVMKNKKMMVVCEK